MSARNFKRVFPKKNPSRPATTQQNPRKRDPLLNPMDNNQEILNTLRQIQDRLEGPDSTFATIGDYYDAVASARYSRDEDFRQAVDGKLERSQHLWGSHVNESGNNGRAHGQAVMVSPGGNIEVIEYGTSPQLATAPVESNIDENGERVPKIAQIDAVTRVIF